MSYDVIVVGLGGVGSFALSALTKQTRNVLGVERFVKCHAFGSSHGASRIYRQAYFEHANYVPWIRYSMEEFRRLETAASTNDDAALMQECGTLILEEPGGPVIESCTNSARQHDIPVQVLSQSDLRERYPQFDYDGSELVGLLEPGGGFVRPEGAMEAALVEAESRGATVLERTIVKSIQEVQDDNGNVHVEVRIERDHSEDDDVVTAQSVIVSAGSWASTLLPSWAPHLQVTRQLQGWIDVSSLPNRDLYDPSNMPTWYLSSPKSRLPIYGIPADPLSDNPHWIKTGLHLREVTVNPNESPFELSDAEWTELDEAAECAFACSSEMTWASAKPCLYTMSPDGHFLVGRPAGSRRTIAAAGLSGHGFKMTPALGQMLADWALEMDTTDWKADFLTPSRFQV